MPQNHIYRKNHLILFLSYKNDQITKKMKHIILFAALMFATLVSCKKQEQTAKQEEKTTTEEIAYFGGSLESREAQATEAFISKMQKMNAGDSIKVKLRGGINKVCQAKGCWMRVAAGEEELMVRFKDYGFFVPKDAAGKETVIQGYAFVEEMSVEEQQHYAEDAGKSAEEIATITSPKKTFSFTADAVAIHD